MHESTCFYLGAKDAVCVCCAFLIRPFFNKTGFIDGTVRLAVLTRPACRVNPASESQCMTKTSEKLEQEKGGREKNFSLA